jgi:hypothetical protein
MSDPLKTDKNVYLEPAPAALPPAGSALTDPTFGTTILRVTDERMARAAAIAYSYWPSLEQRQHKALCFLDQQPTIYDFDPVGVQGQQQARGAQLRRKSRRCAAHRRCSVERG